MLTDDTDGGCSRQKDQPCESHAGVWVTWHHQPGLEIVSHVAVINQPCLRNEASVKTLTLMLGWASLVGNTLPVVTHGCARKVHIPEDNGSFAFGTFPALSRCVTSFGWLSITLSVSSMSLPRELLNLKESSGRCKIVPIWSEVGYPWGPLNLQLVSEVLGKLGSLEDRTQPAKLGLTLDRPQ